MKARCRRMNRPSPPGQIGAMGRVPSRAATWPTPKVILHPSSFVSMEVKRTGIVLKPTNSRVVIRPFEPINTNRIEKILARISSLSEREVEVLLERVMREFRERHQRTREFF